MPNRVYEIMSARSSAPRIASEDDSLSDLDWMASLELTIVEKEANRLEAHWKRVGDDARAALEKLGAPEPDDDAKHKRFMEYVEGAK